MPGRNPYEKRNVKKVNLHNKFKFSNDDGYSVGEIIKLEEMVFNTASEPIENEPPFDSDYNCKIISPKI